MSLTNCHYDRSVGKRLTIPAFIGTMVLACVVMVSGQTSQPVPAEWCELVTDTGECFVVTPGENIQVGQNVVALRNQFRLCMDIDTVRESGGPVKVILAIDYSGSMCTSNPANDPTNQRLLAAHLFVDSLAKKSPQSQVAILLFYANKDNVTAVTGPLLLNSRANIDSLHHTIYRGKCEQNPDPYYPRGLPKVVTLAKVMATYQGIALDSALKVIDRNYTAADSASRHVIILTDDGWTVADDFTPQDVLRRYHAAYPGRKVPKIHAVFLTYNSQVSTDVRLQAITDSTGGKFIPSASPATIVQRLNDILTVITISRKESLSAVTITNQGKGTAQNVTITPVPGSPNDFIINAPPLDLAYGQNTIIIGKTYKTVDGQSVTSYDTLRITRLLTEGSTITNPLFSVDCDIDTFDVSLLCAPPTVNVNDPVTVTAKVDPPKARLFAPGAVTVTALTTAEASAPGTQALFHLDGNLTDATGVNTAAGSPSFTGTDAAFKSSMNGGSFTVTLSSQTGDGAVELWIRRGVATSAGTVVQGAGYTLAILADGRIRFTAGSTTITSELPIRTGSWTHVAVDRSGGSVSLYVNGLASGQPVRTAVDFGGATTVTAPSGLMIDECRFSTISRRTTVSGTVHYAIPSAGTITWTVNGAPSTGVSVVLPSDLWGGSGTVGLATLGFRSSAPGGIIINLYHIGTNDGSWSINSNPVTVRQTGGVPGVPVRVALLDTDADGFLDRMHVFIPDTVVLVNPLPPLTSLVGDMSLSLHGGAVARLQPRTLELLSSHTLRIDLTENTGTNFETGWQSASIRFQPVIMTAADQPLAADVILDSAGPVVARAYYMSNGAPSAIKGKGDTLSVQLSEPVIWKRTGISAPADVFVYYHLSGDATGTAFARLVDTNLVDKPDNWQPLVLITNGFVILPPDDSLQLRPGRMDLTDMAGNGAPQGGRRAVIEWPPYNTVVMAAGPNPFVIGQDLPQPIKTFYANVLAPVGGSSGRAAGGTVVGVQSRIPLKMQSADGTYGKGIVFDALGNTLARDLPVRAATIGSVTDYGVYWDGRNTNGRYVGNGTYLIVITVTDVNDNKVVKRIKLALKRKG